MQNAAHCIGEFNHEEAQTDNPQQGQKEGKGPPFFGIPIVQVGNSKVRNNQHRKNNNMKDLLTWFGRPTKKIQESIKEQK